MCLPGVAGGSHGSWFGGLGNDLYGGRGTTLITGAFDDGPGANTLRGASEDDSLFGDQGKDVLRGGAGDDNLICGTGADILTRSAGADVFVLTALGDSRKNASSLDQINDFNTGVDRFDLSQIDTDANRSGDQTVKFISSTSFSNKARELRYSAGSGQLMGDIDGDGDGGKDFVVEFGKNTGLVLGDLIL